MQTPPDKRSDVTLLPEPKKSISKLSPVKCDDSDGELILEELVEGTVGLVLVVPGDSMDSSSEYSNCPSIKLRFKLDGRLSKKLMGAT